MHGRTGMNEARPIHGILQLARSNDGSDGASRGSLLRLCAIVLRQAYHETRVRRWRGLRGRWPQRPPAPGASYQNVSQ